MPINRAAKPKTKPEGPEIKILEPFDAAVRNISTKSGIPQKAVRDYLLKNNASTLQPGEAKLLNAMALEQGGTRAPGATSYTFE